MLQECKEIFISCCQGRSQDLNFEGLFMLKGEYREKKKKKKLICL